MSQSIHVEKTADCVLVDAHPGIAYAMHTHDILSMDNLKICRVTRVTGVYRNHLVYLISALRVWYLNNSVQFGIPRVLDLSATGASVSSVNMIAHFNIRLKCVFVFPVISFLDALG